jgi:outer membrane protein OmpA-like peptidoglycan-associated protein
MTVRKFVILFFLSCFILSANLVQAQDQIEHYVVIGAFRKHDGAIKWTDWANKKNFNAQYAMNEARSLYYVYILATPDKKKAFSLMLKIRVETSYNDAWVFSGKLGAQAEEEPVVEPVVEEPVEEPTPVEQEPIFEEVQEPEPVVEEPVVEKPKGKPFLFKLVSEEEEVLGEIHVLESHNATQYQAFNGNEVVYLASPRNSENAFIAAVQAPGYRPVELTIDYNDPSVFSTGVGNDGEVIIPIELVRSKKGDYIEFNKVKFFGNSAVFQPESRIELDGLVDIMKDQPKYKIKVHGHCNGKQSRNIVAKGSSNEFFETSTLNERKTVSSKELTQLRADLVKEYLVSQGIDGKRIKTKAEGGKVMIYPQGSTLSGYNDRIEIEIKKH